MTEFSPNRSWTPALDRKAAGLKWLLLDVDGVLTDGRIHMGRDGELFKSFHARDGLAIQIASKAGLEVGILSARSSEIVARRAAELDFSEVIQGREDKAAAFRELLDRHGLDPACAAYVGDDLQDLPVLDAVGLSAAPADAAPEVLAAVDFVTAALGGHGCVRELVERILVAQGAWSGILRRFAVRDASDAPPR